MPDPHGQAAGRYRLLLINDRSKPCVVKKEGPSTRPLSRRRHGARLQLPPPTPENCVADVAESASATLQEPDASSVEELLNTKSFESIAATPTHSTIDGSSSTFQSSCEKPVAGAAVSASGLTLQEQDEKSLDKFLLSSEEEPITASSQMVLRSTIDDSSNTHPSSCEKLLIYDARSASAPTLHEPNVSSSEELLETGLVEKSIAATPPTVLHNMINVSPPSDSSLWSPIFIRYPPNWYQMFYIRMDSGGSFHMYPKLKGPFQSLQEAEAAINNHIDERRRASSNMNFPSWIGGYNNAVSIRMACQKRVPIRQHDLAHELKDLVNFQWFREDQKSYYHFNFIRKPKKLDDGNLFFAEVSRLLQTDNWVVSCCWMMKMMKPNDNGHCNGCTNTGSFKLRHPENTCLFSGGHMDGCLPFGGDSCTDSDDEDEDAYVARLKLKFDY